MIGGTTWPEPEKPNKSEDKSLNMAVKILQSEYKMLIALKTRVDVAVERMTNDSYCGIEDVLRILGTELALQRADEIREEEKQQREEYLRSLKAEEGSNASDN